MRRPSSSKLLSTLLLGQQRTSKSALPADASEMPVFGKGSAAELTAGNVPRGKNFPTLLVSLTMSDEVLHLRSQARRCRRLAENVSNDKDRAVLRRVARDFDEAADELEEARN
jgi:hypothetical protein